MTELEKGYTRDVWKSLCAKLLGYVDAVQSMYSRIRGRRNNFFIVTQNTGNYIHLHLHFLETTFLNRSASVLIAFLSVMDLPPLGNIKNIDHTFQIATETNFRSTGSVPNSGWTRSFWLLYEPECYGSLRIYWQNSQCGNYKLQQFLFLLHIHR